MYSLRINLTAARDLKVFISLDLSYISPNPFFLDTASLLTYHSPPPNSHSETHAVIYSLYALFHLGSAQDL